MERFTGKFRLDALPLLVNNARSLLRQSIDYASGYRLKLYYPFVVFPRHRIAFLAVPRCGTTSVRFALTPLAGRGLDFTRYRYRNTFGHYLRTCTPREAAGRYSGYFRFTFVRNPWTRLYSCYLAKVRAKSNRHFRRLGLAQCRTFEEFALRVCDIPDDKADPHIQSQDAMLTYRGSFLPDRVYRFERFLEEWRLARREIESRSGIALAELPHYYPMETDRFCEAYTDRLADLVGERYKADCVQFGYEFPG